MDFQDISLVLNGVLFSAGDFLFSWPCQNIALVFSKMHFIEAYSQNHEICNIWVTKTNTGSSWEQYRHSHGLKLQSYDISEGTCLCRLFKNECSLLLNTLAIIDHVFEKCNKDQFFYPLPSPPPSVTNVTFFLKASLRNGKKYIFSPKDSYLSFLEELCYFQFIMVVLEEIFYSCFALFMLAILQRDILSLIWGFADHWELEGDTHRNSTQISFHSQFQILSRRKNSLIW